MRSRAGVGITPPKVLGAAKPTSSVMIKSTLGAPLGGTTRGGHQGLDCAAFSLITPPNLGSGGGSCLPEMVVVALGEPGTPVTIGSGSDDCGFAVSAVVASGLADEESALATTLPFSDLAESDALDCLASDFLLSVSLQPAIISRIASAGKKDRFDIHRCMVVSPHIL